MFGLKKRQRRNFSLTSNPEIISTFTEPRCFKICTKVTQKNEEGIARGQPPETSKLSKFIRPFKRISNGQMYFNFYDQNRLKRYHSRFHTNESI